MTALRSRAALRPRLLALLTAALGIALVPLVAAPAQAQATRTWVSGVGDDVNPCSRTAPCKTFAGAISKTATGGSINVLDPGGFGAVTITKSITIDGSESFSSITNSSTTGIIINAAGDADVILRGIDIMGGNAPGGTAGSCGGVAGISILAARSVRLDNVQISGQADAIKTPLTNSSPDVFVDIAMTDVDLTHNCAHGLLLEPAAGHPTRVTVSDSHVTQSSVALRVGAGAEVWASGTRLNLNDTGVQLAGGVAHAGCGTEVVGNATNGAFTDNLCGDPVTVVPPPAPAPTTPTTGTGTTPTPTVVEATYCTVPKLTGRTLAQATTALKGAGCGAAKVARKKARKPQRGKVLSQGVTAGTDVRLGTKVLVVVGR